MDQERLKPSRNGELSFNFGSCDVWAIALLCPTTCALPQWLRLEMEVLDPQESALERLLMLLSRRSGATE